MSGHEAYRDVSNAANPLDRGGADMAHLNGAITGNYAPGGGTVPRLNAGTINLQGANGVGVYVLNGGKVSSSGTINVDANPLCLPSAGRAIAIHWPACRATSIWWVRAQLACWRN